MPSGIDIVATMWHGFTDAKCDLAVSNARDIHVVAR